MKTLMKFFLAVVAVGLVVWGVEGVALAAQGVYIPDYSSPTNTTQPGWMHNIPGNAYVGYPPDYSTAPKTNGWINEGQQGDLTATGKITNLDFAHRTLALDDGKQFTLPASLEYSNFPTIGEPVEVTFSEQNGQKVVRWIDLDDTADSHSGS